MPVSEVRISASGARISDAAIASGEIAITFPQQIAPGDDLLLRRSEVAALLRVSQGYLRQKGARLLPVVRIGGAVRHRLSDVLALIQQRTDKAAGGVVEGAGELPPPRLPGQAG
jgi:hypothetical protein